MFDAALFDGAPAASGGSGTYTAVANVRAGTDRGDGTIGTLAVPAPASVLTGVATDATTGTYVPAPVAKVRNGYSYGAPSAPFVGTDVSPAVGNVVSGIGYGAAGTEFTGTYAGGGGTYPSITTVLQGISFGPTGSPVVGTVTLPGVSSVVSGVQYGAGGTQYTGTAAGGGGGRSAAFAS